MRLRKIFLAATLTLSLFVVLGSLPSAAFAATNNQAKSAKTTDQSGQPTGRGSVKGYDSNGKLRVGSIVQLNSQDNQTVEIATAKNNKLIYGVVIDPHLLSVTLTNSAFKHQVYVATSGSYDVLVSTEGGAIKAGDWITVSSTNGVGMNVGGSGAQVVGQAIRGFNGKTGVIGQTVLKGKSGKTIKTVQLGIIPVAINIQVNPNKQSTKADVPSFLEKVGQEIADKPVTGARLYLSAAIALLSVIVALTIMVVGIRKGMISIGRNPLSKRAVYRGILEVIVAGLLVLIVGMFAVYLILRL